VVDVFGRGLNNTLYQKWYTTSGGWTPNWYQMPLPVGHGLLSSGPDSASWGPTRCDVVARVADGTVEHWYWDGTWHLENLGGNINGEPTIVSREPGSLDVFANIGNTPYRDTYTAGVGWSGWTTMYGLIVSAPDAASWGKNRIDLVAQGFLGNSSVMHAWTGS